MADLLTRFKYRAVPELKIYHSVLCLIALTTPQLLEAFLCMQNMILHTKSSCARQR